MRDVSVFSIKSQPFKVQFYGLVKANILNICFTFFVKRLLSRHNYNFIILRITRNWSTNVDSKITSEYIFVVC